PATATTPPAPSPHKTHRNQPSSTPSLIETRTPPARHPQPYGTPPHPAMGTTPHRPKPLSGSAAEQTPQAHPERVGLAHPRDQAHDAAGLSQAARQRDETD